MLLDYNLSNSYTTKLLVCFLVKKTFIFAIRFTLNTIIILGLNKREFL